MTNTELSPTSDEFTSWTKEGLEGLQAVLGVTKNGILALGQAVFEPSAVRVTSLSSTLGTPAQPGQSVLSATSTTRQVDIALNADQQSEVAVGDKVAITLPNNQTTPGVISSVGTVASAGQNGGTPTVTVQVTPTDPLATGTWDQAPVERDHHHRQRHQRPGRARRRVVGPVKWWLRGGGGRRQRHPPPGRGHLGPL